MARHTYQQVVDRLSELQRTGERRPAEVVELGRWLFQEYKPSALSLPFLPCGTSAAALDPSEPAHWLLTEQVFLATLDVKDWDFANQLLSTLRRKFTQSNRVDRLAAMLLEAQGQYRDAGLVYNRLIEAEPTDMFASKRKIAIAKAQGQTSDAIVQLNKYLDIHANDLEAWLELADLYLRDSLHAQASFCLEEAIMLQPHNHILNQKYGEIQYTLGHYAVAFKYFCRAVELCTDYLRGLYALKLCVGRLRPDVVGNTGRVQKATETTAPPSADVLDQIDLLATERILAVTNGTGKGAKVGAGDRQLPTYLRSTVEEWLKEVAA
ncbi:tetratricopeptide repeat domain-containing protein [Tieghemiomyces parasiticus]|uniref:ER membrane protein complex subunit 2 n=1 Tax=Tieghemiomyces parasiticus TaxID=78921 RepID=A0A9W8A2F8_9FUNG|nr:tetratricopeptide repeat domain-containing protein [Tieghemiomyces parasiticus]